jgi:hypothetical protein
MIFYQYDLPNAVTVSGTFKVRIWSTLNGLSVPMKNTFRSIGDSTEVCDDSTGVLAVQQLQVEIGDDYSVYAEGFWHKVLSADQTIKVRFYLVEKGVDTFYFYGTVQPGQVNWTDIAINEPTYRRRATVNFLSAVYMLMDPNFITMTQLVTEILARASGTGTIYWDIVTALRLKDIFACMLSASGLNNGFQSSDAVFVSDPASFDFQYQDDGFGGSPTYWNFDNLWVPTTNTPGPTTYFAAGSPAAAPLYWPNLYADCRAFAADFAGNFGMQIQMNYVIDLGQPEGGRHIVEFRRRKNAYAKGLVFADNTYPVSNKIKAGSELDASSFLIDGVRMTKIHDGGSMWISKRFATSITPGGTPPPPNATFGIDGRTLFSTETMVANSDSWVIWAGASAATIHQCLHAKSWDYTHNMVINGTGVIGMDLEGVTALFFYWLFTVPRKQITRDYGIMAPTLDDGSATSHTLLNTGRKTTIDDGSGAATYFANKIIKRAMQAGVQVEWIK